MHHTVRPPSPVALSVIPFLVAVPLFLQNLTATVLATALPSLADALGSDVLHLNLAITLYLVSVAVSLPLAAWLCERVGARRIFCSALLIFSLGSLLSALSQNLWQLAASRAFQGIGGAMMIPVGRLILLRSIAPSEIVKATIWYTVPPVIGSLLGPLLGGFIVTYLSWQWLFLINLPIALGACIVALKILAKDELGQKIPLDFTSYGLMALTLLTLLSGLAGSGKGLLEPAISVGLIASGLLFSGAYWWHSKTALHPVVDFSLLRFKTFNASMIGGFGIRVGQGAAPFMLPLLFQLGFGLSPLKAGSLVFVSAVGSLLTRPILTTTINRYGFRNMLIGSTIVCSLLYFGFALLRPGMSYLVLVTLLLLNGAARGMLLVGMNTLGYLEIPKPSMSYATSLSTMNQQVSNTLGIAIAVLMLNWAMNLRGSIQMATEDFWLGFVFLGLVNSLALFAFVPLRRDIGVELQSVPPQSTPPLR
jgi:EmrB/QacA subfamily drug resistance transporter